MDVEARCKPTLDNCLSDLDGSLLPRCFPPCTNRANPITGQAQADIYVWVSTSDLPRNWPKTYPEGTYTGTLTFTGSCVQ